MLSASYVTSRSAAAPPLLRQSRTAGHVAEDTAAVRQGNLHARGVPGAEPAGGGEHLPLLRHGIRNFQGELLFFHFFGVDQNSHMLWGKFGPTTC